MSSSHYHSALSMSLNVPANANRIKAKSPSSRCKHIIRFEFQMNVNGMDKKQARGGHKKPDYLLEFFNVSRGWDVQFSRDFFVHCETSFSLQSTPLPFYISYFYSCTPHYVRKLGTSSPHFYPILRMSNSKRNILKITKLWGEFMEGLH